MATQVNDSIEILEAKQVELTNWRKRNVYDETEDVGQRVILVKWVITQKFKNNKMIYKTHLVARGFEEENLNNICKDSPTCCKDNFCLVVSIIVSNSWIIHSLHVKSAFWQGRKIDFYAGFKVTHCDSGNLMNFSFFMIYIFHLPGKFTISKKVPVF